MNRFKIAKQLTSASLLWAGVVLFAWGHQFNLHHFYTSKKTKVIFYQTHAVPILDISMAFRAGSAYDDDDFGLSALTTRLLNQGSKDHNSNDIAKALDETGAQFQAETNRDMVVLSLRTLTEASSLNNALSVYREIITSPEFPLDAFNREKKQQLIAIMQAKESPDDVANLTFYKALYQDHPYAHPIEGTEHTVNGLTAEQVRGFYQRYFVAENATLILVGDISREKAHEIAESLSTPLPKGKKAPPIKEATPIIDPQTLRIPFPSTQTVMRIGQLGIQHQIPEYFPLIVGNYILGGGVLVSRLSNEVREKRGLTYGVYSQFSPMPGRGPFIISLSTQNAKATEALTITQDTLKAFVKDGPTEEELAAAKQYLTGSFPLSLASNRDIANTLLRIAFYELPDDYLDRYVSRINAVQIEDIKAAFKRYIHPERQIVVEVGRT